MTENAWDGHLALASSDWNESSVLNASVADGKTNPKNCRPKSGRAEICSNSYGSNGWLGLAQIWISGDHIVPGVVTLNDSYFDTPTYDTPEWRQMVTCQEIGHIFGLGHQDEDFDNLPLGTCMDYTSDPTPNQHPNQHDKDMLGTIYAYLDSVNTYKLTDEGGDDGGKGNNGKGGGKKGKPEGVGRNIDPNNPSFWGAVIRRDARGRSSLYELDLGNGKKVFTFVTWADQE